MDELSFIRKIINNREGTGEEYDRENAFYIADLSDIIYKYKVWMKMLPRVKPFFAMKTNPDPEVIATMAKLGTGFDCSSLMEIQSALNKGVDPDDIIYANTCKQPSYLRYAAKCHVTMVTLDDEFELRKIKTHFPAARLVVRIFPADISKAKSRQDMKAGCTVDDALCLLQTAKSLGLNVVGISFHAGSGCTDSSVYLSTIRMAKGLFESASQFGYKFTVLNIGGGFSGFINGSDVGVPFDRISSEINTALDKYFPPSMGVNIIAEPGRYFVTTAFTLVVKVIGKRMTKTENTYFPKSPKVIYFINEGSHGAFRGRLYDKGGPPLSAPIVLDPMVLDQKRASSKQQETALFGPTCDPSDVVLNSCMLPLLDLSDWLIFRNMGAYTISLDSRFNGFPETERHYYHGNNINIKNEDIN